uniref:Beta-1,4-mannosyl-glycoprotein 4-beta-N-acetylglucosaminyltransferase n=2 Tax=Bactrocera dorsalis TaxID=27457 RepID=A0A034W1T4_BACDO
MFQRNGANATTRLANNQHPYSDIEMPDVASSTTTGGKTTLTKKLLLTLLVLAQICFISCLWLLQLGDGLNTSLNEVTAQNGDTKDYSINTNNLVNKPRRGALLGMRRVNFITNSVNISLTDTADRKVASKQEVSQAVIENSQSGKESNFRKDFYLKLNRLNKTIEYRNRSGFLPELDNDVLWCFRKGSIDEQSQISNDEAAQDIVLSWEEENTQCKCRAGWHGRDCGQPEVMWRALLTSKSHFQLQEPTKTRSPNRLVHLLEGNFFNLDLLDLQISMLADVVDYFVIYIKPARKDYKTIQHWLRETLPTNKYMIYLCDKEYTLNKKENCTIKQAYAHFHQQLQQNQIKLLPLKPSDLLLYTDDRVLPSPEALQFLKYYAKDVRNVLFRLKYVVYGFYWQHPKQTYLNGLVSSFVHMDNPSQLNGDESDPAKIFEISLTASNHPAPFVIGDLNHFGGWFCKYCQQPEEIVAELHAATSSLTQVQFADTVRNHNIDAAYLQKLIATGIYVDGKMQLLRNRRYSDKYYAPSLAETDNSKYGNLLVNLFESFDDDIEYEAGNY